MTRELRERGYSGAYTAVKRFIAAIRPSDLTYRDLLVLGLLPGKLARLDLEHVADCCGGASSLEGWRVIGPTGAVRVLVATKPVDFRKGAEGLAALVCETMQADPFSGA